jgi:hypothetical protein
MEKALSTITVNGNDEILTIIQSGSVISILFFHKNTGSYPIVSNIIIHTFL